MELKIFNEQLISVWSNEHEDRTVYRTSTVTTRRSITRFVLGPHPPESRNVQTKAHKFIYDFY